MISQFGTVSLVAWLPHRSRGQRGSARATSLVVCGECGVGCMDRFVANFTLRLDSKGRVSIPGPFRSVLARDGLEGLYCYPALDRPAIDAGGNALMAEIEAVIGRYAPFSDQREQFALALYGTSETLKIDGEGRVVLSENLKRQDRNSKRLNSSHLGISYAVFCL